ncbi:MAG: metallopeptidase TldD-related protein [candidate division WOR-3 bacterium]|jgi:predicted Zn-dependent protease
MKQIINEIRNAGFDDYRVIEVNSRDHQLYMLKDRFESKRTVDSRYFEITLYKQRGTAKEQLQGEFTFDYKPGTDLSAYLEQANIACSMIKNRRYALVKSSVPADVKVLDPKLSDPPATGELLSEIIYKGSTGPSIRLSSAEIYIKRSVINLVTSTGLNLTKEKGLIEVEVSMLAKKGKQEQEMNFHIQRRSVDDLNLEQCLQAYKDHTRNMLRVSVPNSGKATTVFPVTDIYELLSPLIFHSSGRAKDKGISRFKMNEQIIEPGPNTFNMKSSGLLAYGLYSDPFDDDGIPGQEHTIIDHGVFQKHWTTKRYADYLGVQPTGAFKNLVLEPVTQAPFEGDDHYEIIQFSDLSPDPVTGDFVAEIRFGYHISNGKRTPVKGGSISGNVFQALKNLYSTDERVFEGNYLGPKHVALKDLSISGQ